MSQYTGYSNMYSPSLAVDGQTNGNLHHGFVRPPCQQCPNGQVFQMVQAMAPVPITYTMLQPVPIVNNPTIPVPQIVPECQHSSSAGSVTRPPKSGSITDTIDNKIEQAMNLVKRHLMLAVREEVDVLKEQLADLIERNKQLQYENGILRAAASAATLAKLQQPRQRSIRSSTSSSSSSSSS